MRKIKVSNHDVIIDESTRQEQLDYEEQLAEDGNDNEDDESLSSSSEMTPHQTKKIELLTYRTFGHELASFKIMITVSTIKNKGVRNMKAKMHNPTHSNFQL